MTPQVRHLRKVQPMKLKDICLEVVVETEEADETIRRKTMQNRKKHPEVNFCRGLNLWGRGSGKDVLEKEKGKRVTA